MYFLLYASSAVRPLNDDDLLDLLEVSRRNNVATNITGMLLYFESNFLQYLEGEKEDVDALYARIVEDTRNHGLFVLETADIAERAFPGWTMGYKYLRKAQGGRLGAFDLNAEALEKRLPAELPITVLSMMRTFYRTAHRYAAT